ncbi:serine/threonine protein kinase [Amycolatopsis sp. H20-H5]|uniref:serine/threonine protein kinase n=1 Tax=Amycolatopsis sp. H20-H5 TaxID=3046309 RepID=UPI002DBCD4E2|nr:serine/threonine-protein kinase [Amycolatopsis sp. H20-H5]MEC3980449.1 serine/threonine-protein kinase [Amycolatopsis sp. H20-H5]
MTNAGDRSRPGLMQGAVLGQRFQVDRWADDGGMGVAYLALDLESRKQVIVKVPQLPVTADLDFEARRRVMGRFAREGRYLSDLDHPNIPTVVGQGEYGSVPYLAMTYIRGLKLTRYRQNTAPRPIEFAAIGTSVAEALAACHAGGIIHRDLKPDNLLVGENGVVYVIDFGIAIPSNADATRYTRNFVGTDDYAAPEQFLGGEPVVESDLYSLGCVFYHLLAGRPPFIADGGKTLEKQHLEDLPAPLSQFVGGVDPDLAELSLALLAKNIEDRPGIEDVRAVLRPHLPAAGSPEPSPVSLPDVTIPYRTPDAVRPPEAPARSRATFVRPFRARRRRDFLTEADIAETIRRAMAEHDGATAVRMLTELRGQAIETFGTGNPKLEPIERALNLREPR